MAKGVGQLGGRGWTSNERRGRQKGNIKRRTKKGQMGNTGKRVGVGTLVEERKMKEFWVKITSGLSRHKGGQEALMTDLRGWER